MRKKIEIMSARKANKITKDFYKIIDKNLEKISESIENAVALHSYEVSLILDLEKDLALKDRLLILSKIIARMQELGYDCCIRKDKEKRVYLHLKWD